MPHPTATYRLQLRNGVTLETATGLVPYLRALGVSHLYLSPVFRAQPGSTHGYDVIDPNEIDAEIGGRAGLEALSATLAKAGMGLILDIVPNHMAFTMENPSLGDVLRKGRDSAFASWFDIDWSQPKLILPMLPKPFETMRVEGAFTVERDAAGAWLCAPGLRAPLAADTPGVDAAIDAPDPGAIGDIHTHQMWRLTEWRLERDGLTHRRFFNVSSLIGVRVEDEAVFEATHRLLFDLVEAGHVDGLRVDHVDGLVDPGGYLDRLRAHMGERPVWIEKILSGEERLPPWPVSGTTGYIASRAIGSLLTDPGGLERIDTDYRALTGREEPFHEVLMGARRRVVRGELVAETRRLCRMAKAAAAADPVAVDYGPEAIRESVTALLTGFPRYRTYLSETIADPGDIALIETITAQARPAMAHGDVLDFVAGALIAPASEAAHRFRLRFQQATGAVIAKSQEDTAFYRYNRLLSANEVGAEPDEATLTPAAFHAAMARRAAEMPGALTLTSSHDSKRSEDARMRIAAITHAPDAFAAIVAAGEAVPGAHAVDANLRWYLYQTVLALWQPGAEIGPRVADHLVKAMREAKEDTEWTAPDTGAETGALAFAAALTAAMSTEDALFAPLTAIADDLSMIQLALKLTIPGVPDIYQGCEIASHTLTDPDNRRAVDFDHLAALLSGKAAADGLDARKMALTRILLRARARHGAVFTAGYRPVPVAPGALAFTRVAPEGAALVVLVRLDPAAETGFTAAGERLWPTLDGDGSPRVEIWLDA